MRNLKQQRLGGFRPWPRAFGSMLLALLALAGVALNARAQSGSLILVGLTNVWRYNQTFSYDGANWTARTFDDSALPNGRGVLALEDNNTFVTSRTNTVLAIGRSTYYFRTHFLFPNDPARVALTFSNIVDDGAVYYLNGVEIARFSMTNNSTPISYATLATSHEATAFDVFTISGPIVETNLVTGDNVLAVEVHQATTGSTDIVFGLALSATASEMTLPPLRLPLTPPVFGYTTVNAFPGLNFGQPVCIASPPGETNRLFVLNKLGQVYVITNLASPNLTTFMTAPGNLNTGSESGLLGLAFHPDYANPTNRYFFLFYSLNTNSSQGSGLHQRVSRFQTSASNPNQALAGTELVLINQRDPAGNHNGGDLHFGPDGYLYISLGDGGAQYDGDRNSQIITSNFFSAIMRIDVDTPPRPGSLMPNPHRANTNNNGTLHYRIPADNPYIGRMAFDGLPINPANIRTEFYAIGFRNPWRFSFDRATGFLYCGDVGQDTWEEIDVITKGGNYGWAYREGLHPGYRAGTPVETMIDPIQEYRHGGATNQGNSVTGGVVYRGNRLSQLAGWYVFADYASGNVWRLRHDGTNTVPFQRIAGRGGISAFGIDPSNDDVLMTSVSDGGVYRLIYNTNNATGAPLPPTLADTGAFADLASITNQTQPFTPGTGLVPYDLNVPFWSDHARKTRWFAAGTNGQIGFNRDGAWSFPAGMAWVKHFDLEMTNGVPSSARRLETRILVKNSEGTYGVTYRWGNSLTNATLVADPGFDEAFTINDGGTMRTQVWHYPSRAECTTCHTPVGGFALGFNTPQLNRDFDHGGGPANQIAALSHAGYFSASVSNIHSLRALAPATNGTTSLEWRVRSYLSANCAQCHQPGGTGLGSWSANITNLTADAGLIHGALNNDFGNTNNRVIVPGSLSNSMLLHRISIRGPGQMPPLATSVLDTGAIQLLSAWITNDLPGHQTFAQWQAANFGATNAPNAAAGFDADGDGSPNYSEYIARTQPLNSNDVWKVSMGANNGEATLHFVQPANRAFEVQWATNLNTPALWHLHDRPENRPTYPSLPASVSIRDSITNAPFKFYRVKLSPP